MKTLFTAVAAVLLSLPAVAQDATLVKTTGKVSVCALGAPKCVRAKPGTALIFGDMIKTAQGAVAQIALGERGAVLVRESSLFTLAGTPARTTLDFQFGEFLIGLRKKLEKGQSFKVRTRSAVAAVRGTLFWGKSGEDKTTTYAGFGHTIEVEAQGKKVLVEAGQTVTVPFGQAPSEVKPSDISMEYTKHFAVEGDLQGLESLAELPKK